MKERFATIWPAWPLLAILLLAGLTPDALEAQEPETTPEAASDAPPRPEGRGVTVHVIGTAEELKEIGGSGSVVTSSDIRTQSYDDPNQALRKVPGVYLRQEDGFGLFPNISLRGVDTTRSAKVTIMEDGVLTAPAPYSAPAAYYSPTTGRMSAIEVLKGSSQVKYGPHTTGGVINYQSTPIPHERDIYLRTLYGSNNEFRSHAYYGETVDTGTRMGIIGFLVEGFFRTTDGFKEIDLTPDFRDGGDTGFTKVEPMFKFSWEPELAVYNRFEGKIGYTDLEAREGYLGLSEGDFEANPFRRYAASRFDKIQTKHVRSYLRHVIEPTEETRITSTFYYNKFARDWFKLQDVSSDPADLNGTRLSLSRALAEEGAHLAVLRGEAAGGFRVRHNDRSYYLWGIESVGEHLFDLQSHEHAVTAGVRYHEDRVLRDQRNEVFTQGSDGTILTRDPGTPGDGGNREQESQAIAVFVEDAIKVGDWTVTPGLRFEHVDQQFQDFRSGESGDGSTDAIAGGVGVTYQHDEELGFFGGVHQGFSIPGARAAIRDGLDEETSIGIELGPRYTRKNGALALQAAGFFTRFDDLIVIDNIGGTGTGNTENVGEVLTYGIEVAVQADPGVEFDWPVKNPWHLSFTYTHAELADDSSSTDPESIFSGGQDGNRVPYIPEFALSFGTGIVWKKLGFFVDGYFVDETFSSASNASQQVNSAGDPDSRFGKTDSYVLIDLSARYRATENVTIFAGVQNAFDEEYIPTRHPHGPRAGQPLFAYGGVEFDF